MQAKTNDQHMDSKIVGDGRMEVFLERDSRRSSPPSKPKETFLAEPSPEDRKARGKCQEFTRYATTLNPKAGLGLQR